MAVVLQGWVVGDEAAVERWFDGGKWLGGTEAMESMFRARAAVWVLYLETELWML